MKSAAPVRLAALVLLLLPAGLHGRAADGRPDIILISIDNLRADHLGCYGYGRDTSPHLDALARGATLFEKHISPSAWTLPAHMSILTSMYPSYHGFTRHPERWSASRWMGTWLDGVSAAWAKLMGTPLRYGPAVLLDRLRPGLVSLPEALHAAGYRTGAVVASENLEARFGFSRGFDSFIQNPERTPAVRQNAAALRWIDAQPGKPFFLFLHYYDLHHTLKPGEEADDVERPYDCPEPSAYGFLPGFPNDFRAHGLKRSLAPGESVPPRERKWLIGLYDGCIRSADSGVADLISALRRKGRFDETLLIVTSDHGEEFWDHGFWGHGQSLHQELIRVPLLLKAPGQRTGQRVQDLTSGVDLMPTILEAARVAPGVLAGQMQGLSVRPLLEGRVLDRPAVFSERDFRTSDRAVLTRDGWKLLREFEPRKTLLFDLKRDPGERRDLSAARPGKLAELEEALADFYSGPLED